MGYIDAASSLLQWFQSEREGERDLVSQSGMNSSEAGGRDVQPMTSLRNLQRRSKNMAHVIDVAMKRTTMMTMPIICHVLLEWSVLLSADAGRIDGVEAMTVLTVVGSAEEVGLGCSTEDWRVDFTDGLAEEVVVVLRVWWGERNVVDVSLSSPSRPRKSRSCWAGSARAERAKTSGVRASIPGDKG